LRAAKPDSAGVIIVPPVVFAFCLIGGIGAAFAYGGWITIIPWVIRWPVGLFVFGGGLLFASAGFGRFRKLGTAIRPNQPASQLVTTGVYRITRNPMYVGLVGVLAGIGLFFGSIPMLLSAAVMFFYLDRYVIVREEAYLGRRFGETYQTYCATTRRWV